MTNSRWLIMPVGIAALFYLAASAVSAHEGHRPPQPAAVESQTAADTGQSGNHADHVVANPAVTSTPEEKPAQHEHMMPENEVGGFFVRLGRLHPVVIHFPIALILMVALAELMNRVRPSVLYDSAARFMLIMAAITSLPTAVLGWLFAQGETYAGAEGLYFWWHRAVGIGVVPLTLLTLFIRLRYGSSTAGRNVCALLLAFLTIAVALTGYLGGSLTHGNGHFDIF